jgi:hypothetical protein
MKAIVKKFTNFENENPGHDSMQFVRVSYLRKIT